MDKNLKGAIAVGVILGVVGLAYWGITTRFGTKDTGTDTENEWDLLRKNLGLPESKLDKFGFKFNGEKNQVNFFSNNRFFIYKIENGIRKYIDRGTWSMGGYNLKLDSGKEVSSGSVFKNLQDIITK